MTDSTEKSQDPEKVLKRMLNTPPSKKEKQKDNNARDKDARRQPS